MPLGWCTKKIIAKRLQAVLALKIINMAYLRNGINVSCSCQICVVLCYLEFSVKIGVSDERFPCSEVASELLA